MASLFHDQVTSATGPLSTKTSWTEPVNDHAQPESPTTSEPTEKDIEKSAEQHVNNDNADEQLPDSSSEQASGEAVNEKPPPVNPMMDGSSFPDGGARAWFTVAGASACLFVSFGWINCVAVFQDYYQTHQLSSYSPSTIAWIPSLQVYFMLASGIFVGKIFDDYGPRYLIMGGAFLHVFGLMMLSLSKEYYQILLSQAICSAIGASCLFYPAFNCVTTWFFKKRGAALGAVAAGSSLGGVIFPIMVTHLIPEVGFGWTLRICAFLILALLIFALLTIKSRIKPQRRPVTLAAFFSPMKEPAFALSTAATFFFFWGMFIPFTFIISEARSKGMSAYLAYYLVSILNGASVFGRTVPNIIADKVGRFNIMIVMSVFTVFVILALWLPATGNAPIILFAVLFGIASGAGIGLTPVLVAQISPVKDIGVRTGALYSVSALAALTGSPIGGQIIVASNGSFRNCQIFAGVSTLIGAAFFIAARISLAGVKWVKV